MVQVVWEFRVKPGREEEFEARYGRGGDWERLFRRSSDYRGTVLLRDEGSPPRYLTLDSWTGRAALEDFRREFAPQYEALDRDCENLTEDERLVGCFRALEDAP